VLRAQGNASVIEPQTLSLLHQLKQMPAVRRRVAALRRAAEKMILDDFHRLWNTNFLDNLWIDSTDYKFPNGTIGKVVTYNMEERQRVKIVDYVGTKKVEISKIDEKLKEDNSVNPPRHLHRSRPRPEGRRLVRDMLREKGFQFANVTHEIKEIEGGPKLVHITFNMDEGPKVKIRKIDIVGNKAISDGEIKRPAEDDEGARRVPGLRPLPDLVPHPDRRPRHLPGNQVDEDAEKVVAFYRDKGYLRANVGVPELKVIDDSEDKKTRWIELKIPITEGPRYKVGTFDVAGNTVVKSDYLKPLFKMVPGEYYGEKRIRKGLEKAREVYGAGGYFEFTGFPDYKFHDDPNPNAPEAPEALKAPDAKETNGAPIVDVTMRMQEGEQFFVNRVTFVGNTTTRDNVIRREMRLVEGGIFNTER
jgi:outer membrane protein insertion porin family